MAPEDLTHTEVLDLVSDLIQATEGGKLRWELFDETDERYGLETSGGSVVVESLNNRQHPFVFRLFDREDRKIFELKTEVAPFYSPPEALVGDLFNVARNSVFDVSGTVREIRSSLDL